MSLIVEVKDATFQEDLDMFSKMDPYVVLKIGKQVKRTKTCQEGGQAPKWNQTLAFAPGNFDVMKIEVYDEDLVSPDFVGEAAMNLNKVRSLPGQPLNEWVQVMKKGKNAGRVRLVMTYKPENSQQYQQNQQFVPQVNPYNNPNNANYQYQPPQNLNFQNPNYQLQYQPQPQQQQAYFPQTAPDWNRFGTIPTNSMGMGNQGIPNLFSQNLNQNYNSQNQSGMTNGMWQQAFQMLGNQSNPNQPGQNPNYGGVYGPNNGW